jgi:hypothetical protein
MAIWSLTRFATPLLIVASTAQAAPLLEAPRSFNPMSRTAGAITGPVIASGSRIIFGNGAQTELSYLGEVTAEWDLNGETLPAQIFRVAQDPGELLNGNHLCSADQATTYLVAYQQENYGAWTLTLAAFRGETAPTSINEPALCGTFSFDLDGKIEGAALSATEEAPAQIEPSVEEGAELAEIGLVDLPDAPADESVGLGKWQVSRTTNPLDDTPQVTLFNESVSGWSRMGEPVIFVARCKSNTTEAYAIWHDYVGDDSSSPYEDYKYVTVRLGDAKSEHQRWDVSTDKQATFAPSWAGNLLKQMVTVDQMVLQLTPYGESPITAIFDTHGLREPLKELSSTCGWSF